MKHRDIEIQIIVNVAEHFRLRAYQLLLPGKGITAYHVPRQLCLFLLCEAGYSYTEAGRVLNRKSGSAFNACWKIEKKIRDADSVVWAFLYKYGYKQRAA